nr:reverse transcriptase domain-containing protein [Tanacetum cinerariifolium]
MERGTYTYQGPGHPCGGGHWKSRSKKRKSSRDEDDLSQPWKKCIKDLIELHNIKQRDWESTEDFVRRYKLESRDVKGAPEREVAASSHERKTSFPPWKQQKGNQKQNFKKGGFRSQPRPERKHDRFTLLTKTPKENFALEKGKFKAPPPMTTPVENQKHAKLYEFHREVGHNTDECMHLKKQIEEMLKTGKMSNLIKELKQNNGKDQPKVAKKGETSRKDKEAIASTASDVKETRAVRRKSQQFAVINGTLYKNLSSDHSTGPFPKGPGKVKLLIVAMDYFTKWIEAKSVATITGNQTGARSYVFANTLSLLSTRKPMVWWKEKIDGRMNKCKMPFGMRNAGATYQHLVDKAFYKQISINLKVYMDDLVIKSRMEDEIVRDIEETFKTLRIINMKLNPKKCTFGVGEGMFLGYTVNTKGLKVCPYKVDAVLSLPSPKCIKDVQKLNGKLTSLNTFLAKSAEKSLPFFKTLKKCTKKSDFHWTVEAEEAFKQMKQLIAELPMLTAPTSYRTTRRGLSEEELPEPWILFTDGSSCIDGSGAGLILTNPEGMEFTYALRFMFDATNNEAEYKALIAGLRIAEQIGVKNLQANVDS